MDICNSDKRKKSDKACQICEFANCYKPINNRINVHTKKLKKNTLALTALNTSQNKHKSTMQTINTMTYKPSGPIKSNDMNYMYNHCKKTIENAVSAQELLPIIKILIPLDKLKNKLNEIIDDLYQSLPTNPNQPYSPPQSPPISPPLPLQSASNKKNKKRKSNHHKKMNDNPAKQLKKLYLRSSSIAEIFPDHILVNIIKYLPSREFCSIMPLSTDFLNIMTKYPVLYHQYKVVIDEIPMHCMLNNLQSLIYPHISYHTYTIYI